MIDVNCETWRDLLKFLREEEAMAQDTVNSPATPETMPSSRSAR